MALAGYAVELPFGLAGLVPAHRGALVLNASVQWNYTTVLNLIAIALLAVLAWRFLGTGGPAMLRMMAAPAGKGHEHARHMHHHEM